MSAEHTRATGMDMAGAGGANGDDALSMLSDLEARVSGLKRLHETLAVREREIGAREGRIAEREREAEEAAGRARGIQEEAERAGIEAGRARGEVEERATALAAREAEASARNAAVESEKESLEAERSRIDAESRALVERERAVKERTEAGREQERRLTGLESELDDREMRASERERASAAKEEWLGERERIALERGREVDQVRAEAESRAEELEKALSEVAERERAIQEHEQTLAERERAAAEADRMVAELAEREKELAGLKDRVLSKEEALAEGQAQLARDQAAVAEQARTLSERAADAEGQGAIWSGRTEQMQLQLGEANAARASIETELTQAQAKIKSLIAEVETVASGRGEASAAITEREAKIAELEAALRSAEAARADSTLKLHESKAVSTGSVEAHERAVSEARRTHEAALAERESEIAERDASLRKMGGEVEELKNAVETMRERAERAERGRGTGAGGSDGAAIEEREEAIALLRDRMKRVESENTALEARLVEARTKAGEAEAAAKKAEAERETMAVEPDVEEEGEGPTDRVIGAVQRRQHRLRTYKSLLQGQARKIVAAQSALQRRHADCEQILSQRARLTQAATEVTKREKRAASARARSTASAALLYITATLAVVGVMSWEVAKRVWPGTYIARATIEADAHGRPPSAELLAAWQKDHETLLKDPRLLEFAAERFSRRGLAGTGSAADLKDRLDKDLYVQSPKPGSMTLELRGAGAERTALELDTFITSLKSIADMSRDERGNNLGVAVAQPAAATQEPLTDQRLQYAGMVFGVGAAGSMALGAMLWWRLSRAKKTFDKSQAVEAALDGVDWATIEKTFKKPARGEDEGTRKAA